ncbi:MAG: DMT family transporter [Spirochaetaceae bacterium]|nr:DMT family transporter [Spirochaetaceae bacterium]
MQHTLSMIAGIGYASIFGFSFLVTKNALAVLDPMELIFVRFLLAALLMSLLVLFRVQKVDFRGKNPKLLLAMCLFQPVLYFIFETYGVNESSTSMAGIIIGAIPALVAVLGSVFLKEKTDRAQGLGLGLSVAGVIVVVLAGAGNGSGQEGTTRGLLFLFGAMVSAAFFNVLSRKASETFTDFERTFAMMWSGAISYGVVVLVRWLTGSLGEDQGGIIGALSSLVQRAGSVWYAILYLGVLSSVVAFFLINYTLSSLKASQSAVFSDLVTVITVLAGVLIRKEPLNLAQGLGALLIVFGVWFTNRRGRSQGAKPA